MDVDFWSLLALPSADDKCLPRSTHSIWNVLLVLSNWLNSRYYKHNETNGNITSRNTSLQSMNTSAWKSKALLHPWTHLPERETPRHLYTHEHICQAPWHHYTHERTVLPCSRRPQKCSNPVLVNRYLVQQNGIFFLTTPGGFPGKYSGNIRHT